MRKMCRLLTAILVLLPFNAYAHPSDNVCSNYAHLVEDDNRYLPFIGGNFDSAFNLEVCVIPYPHTGLNDFDIYSRFRHYWHVRRNLVDLLLHLAEYRGRVNAYEYTLNLPQSFRDGNDDDTLHGDGPFQFMLDYWNFIPATPARDIAAQYAAHLLSKEEAIALLDDQILAAEITVEVVHTTLVVPAFLRDIDLARIVR